MAIMAKAATWCYVQFSTGVHDGWYPKGAEPPPYAKCVRALAKPGWVPKAAREHGHVLLGGGHSGFSSGAGLGIAALLVVVALAGKAWSRR